MIMKYKFIDPDNFEVREVVKLINLNLDYVYKNQANIKQTFTNLIPYSDFSIISNISYWSPYRGSNISISDGKLNAYTDNNTVGVISPGLNTTLKAGDYYTLILNTSINYSQSILNEFYIVDEKDVVHRINHDEPIAYNKFGIISKVFKLNEDISNPRFIIGSSDVTKNIVDKFNYMNLIKDSNMIHESGLLYPYIDINKMTYDGDLLVTKNTLYYLLSTRDLSKEYQLDSLIKDGMFPSIYNRKNIDNSEVYSYLETILYNMSFIQEYSLGNDSYRSKAENALKLIGTLYNKSSIKGIFQVLDNSNEYSLLLSLYVLDSINLYMLRHSSYIGVDNNGLNFNIITIKSNIISYVQTHYSKIVENKYLRGGILNASTVELGYLDDNNRYSVSNLCINTQLELIRLMLECNCSDGLDTKLKDIMSFEFPEFPNSFIMPSIVRYNDYMPSDSRLIIDTMFLYFKLLKTYPSVFSKAQLIQDNIVKSISNLKTSTGYYKYDYATGGYIYSSNQYLDSIIDDFSYEKPRSISFESIILCAGEADSDNINVINSTNGDVISKVEYSVKRVDLTLDEVEINSIVDKTFATKDSLNIISSNLNKEVDSLKKALSDDVLIARLKTTFYDIPEVDTLIANMLVDAKAYVDSEITKVNTSITTINNTLKTLDDRLKILESK